MQTAKTMLLVAAASLVVFSACLTEDDQQNSQGATYAVTLCDEAGVCAAGETCRVGLCMADCAADQDCPADAVCVDGSCWGAMGDQCADDASCAAGNVCVDGLCVELAPVLECAANDDCPAGAVCISGECIHGDSDCLSEICNGLDDDCDGIVDEGCDSTEDMDEDGFAADVDCNDADPSINPAAAEVCNAMDDDCDGEVDEVGCDGCLSSEDCGPGMMCVEGQCVGDDLDGDGFPGGLDCDDLNAAVHPGAPELCNELDDDCDGEIDEGCGSVACASSEDCGPGMSCVEGQCLSECLPVAEICNGLDDDCDGEVDEGCEQQCSASDDCGPGMSCVEGQCLSECLPAAEICNGLDDDCDGDVDEGCQQQCSASDDCGPGMTCVEGECVPEDIDADGDGFPLPLDCDDIDPHVHPGAEETCNGMDDDCDGDIDETC